eukprot:Gregarina_sp_Poly_1__10622@NODE_796_length_6257_cov_143_075283_g582_i0_p1_GENE_NODE_796_length_6257_cov_143_075283_g582_i0NODE_796_length_6257_cov_143_075283_g582_i0_p1_ORF_typecomplete_len985_score92_19Acyl_transf_3/PF01757_22/3_1e03Acyl_transf_3/PF01757_22/1_3e33YrhK/PF14145_6/7_8e03YrhK/PF14145_6/0_0098YrhK/PF14145_6/25_NODE_796_length_6257_cov_143_075283_g582_i033025977
MENTTILASLSWGVCLPSTCSSADMTSVLDSVCYVRACSNLSSATETQLCVLTQILHCDPKARFHASEDMDEIYLHCATQDQIVNESNNYLRLEQNDIRALTSCGSTFIRDWRLMFRSGTLQDLGDFDACTAPDSHSKYCLVEYYDVLTSGRCVPESCTEEKMRRFFSFICNYIGTNGMSESVSSSCLDYVNIIPLDLCVTVQLLGCGKPFDMAQASSGVMDTKKILITLLQPTSSSEQLGSPRSFENFNFFLADLDNTISSVSHNVDNVVNWHPMQAVTPKNISYTVNCDLKPVSKEKFDWYISLFLGGLFAIVLPLLGLCAWQGNETQPRLLSSISDSPPPSPVRSWIVRARQFLGSRESLNRFLLNFSVENNLSRIERFRLKLQHGNFPHINGLRSMSIAWIVVGHAFVFGITPGVLYNLGNLSHIWNSLTFQIVYSAQFAVDSFFFISGLMLGIHGPPKISKMFGDEEMSGRRYFLKGGCMWLKMGLHRFLRIVGLYYVVMAISYYTMQYAGFSPRWSSLLRMLRTGYNGGCRKYWWSLALLINNVYPEEAMMECFGHAWFLANDFQFFLVGAMLLIVACYRERWFNCLWWAFLVGSLIMTWHTIIKYDIRLPASYFSGLDPSFIGHHKSMATGILRSMSKFYNKPWCRIPPYLLGIFFGRAYTSGRFAGIISLQRTFKEPIFAPSNLVVEAGPHFGTPSRRTNVNTFVCHDRKQPAHDGDVIFTAIANLMCIATMLFLVLIPYEANKVDAPEWNWLFDACYMAFSRTIWALCLGWLICCISYAVPKVSGLAMVEKKKLTDPVSVLLAEILSQPVFSYVSLVSYALYLIHLPIQEVFYASQRQALALSEGVGWFNGVCFGGIAFAAASALYLFVEIPLANVASYFGL